MTEGPPWKIEPYPFAALEEAKEKAIAAGVDVIDFGVGDPREPTPEFIRCALVDSLTSVSSYPRAVGLLELREAIARWNQARFNIALDSNKQILPTLGAKEIIHSLPAYSLRKGKNVVLVPTPAYPVYARGAQFHGATIYEMPLTAENQFLPDFNAIPTEILDRTALMWLNYPNNPTGRTAPLELYERAAHLAQQHDFVVASDEAYSEIWFANRPVSALQIVNPENVVVVNTLSKRSCMTGYRSGFIAGDEKVITRLRDYRPSVGVTPQDFVQRASIAAWTDEKHVEDLRQQWLKRHEILQSTPLRFDNRATFFAWAHVPDGHTSASFAEWLLDNGIFVTPGSAFGSNGEGFVRIALVPTIEDCERAATKLKEIL